MKQQSKLNPEQQQQQAAEQQARRQPALEFATAEELLRYDLQHTAVPDGIAQRLQKSAGDLPPRPKPAWWKRLWGGNRS